MPSQISLVGPQIQASAISARIVAQEDFEATCNSAVRILDKMDLMISKLGVYREEVSLHLNADAKKAEALLDASRMGLTTWIKLIERDHERAETKVRGLGDIEKLEQRYMDSRDQIITYDMSATPRKRSVTNPEMPSGTRRGNLQRFSTPEFSGDLEDYPTFK